RPDRVSPGPQPVDAVTATSVGYGKLHASVLGNCRDYNARERLCPRVCYPPRESSAGYSLCIEPLSGRQAGKAQKQGEHLQPARSASLSGENRCGRADRASRRCLVGISTQHAVVFNVGIDAQSARKVSSVAPDSLNHPLNLYYPNTAQVNAPPSGRL